jgi:hypothetical protein
MSEHADNLNGAGSDVAAVAACAADPIEKAAGTRQPALGGDCGYTVRDVARRYRVGEDKVRAWIKAGDLAAINTAAVLCGKPRFIVTPEALEKFEMRRAAGPMPKVKRRRRSSEVKDYYPD